MRDLHIRGLRLLRRGLDIRADYGAAIARHDYNLAVERAQEALELIVKGAILLLAADPKRGHRGEAARQFAEVVEKAARRYSSVVAIAAAYYRSNRNWIGGRVSEPGVIEARKNVGGKHTLLGRIHVDGSEGILTAGGEGSTLAMYVDGRAVLRITDTSYAMTPQRQRFVPVNIDEEEFRSLEAAMVLLGQRRAPAKYEEMSFTRDDALEAWTYVEKGIDVLRATLGIIT